MDLSLTPVARATSPPASIAARRRLCSGLVVFALLAAAALGTASVTSASTTHDLRGDWRVCGPDIPPGTPCSAADQLWHITSMNLSSGAFSGSGSGTPPNDLTFQITGTATGDQFEMDNPHDTITYSPHWSGTIAADNNTMSGTWTESGSMGTWYAQRTSGPPPGGGGDADGDGVPDSSDACPSQAGAASNGCPPSTGTRPTGTGVVCNFVSLTVRHTCFAQVGDIGPVPGITPSGEVRFSSNEGGSFPLGTTCNLVSSQTAPATPSCSAEYIAPKGGIFAQVTATYAGDSQHRPSSGSSKLMSAAFPKGCDVFDGCSGTDLDAKGTYDLLETSLGPITLECAPPSGRAGRRPLAGAALKILDLPLNLVAKSCAVSIGAVAPPLQSLNVKFAGITKGALGGFEFKSLVNMLPELMGVKKSEKVTRGGIFGNLISSLGNLPVLGQLKGTGLGSQIGSVLQGESVPLGSMLSSVNDLSPSVLLTPLVQQGMLEGMFKSLFRDPVPAFPTPVGSQGSPLRITTSPSAAKPKKKARKTFVIATGRFTLTSGTRRKVRLTLARPARRFFAALRRRGVGIEFRVVVQATLARGGVPGVAAGKKTIRVRVKPPKKRKRR